MRAGPVVSQNSARPTAHGSLVSGVDWRRPGCFCSLPSNTPRGSRGLAQWTSARRDRVSGGRESRPACPVARPTVGDSRMRPQFDELVRPLARHGLRRLCQSGGWSGRGKVKADPGRVRVSCQRLMDEPSATRRFSILRREDDGAIHRADAAAQDRRAAGEATAGLSAEARWLPRDRVQDRRQACTSAPATTTTSACAIPAS